MRGEDREAAATPPPEPGWRERIWDVGSAARRLFATRVAIFQEELAEKGGLLGKALGALFVALLFATLAGLLLTALLAAVFAKLLGSAVLGILVTLVLYLAVAAAAGVFGAKRMSRLRPFEFPATGREIDRDLEAVRRAAGIHEPEAADDAALPIPVPPVPGADTTDDDFETRFRHGSA